jgi:RNA-binding protein YlmH
MPISDTVASPRLDCIVGALCSLSREKARATVESGLVELDFEREERPDRTVSAPCIISVRGYGRFRINSVSDMTKKGRYRLNAEKFV